MLHPRTYILPLLLALILAACARPTPAPPPEPTASPRPTVPILPTSTPSTQAPPAMQGVYPADILTADGVPLKGDYYRPIAERAPGVVLLHGIDRTRSDWQILAGRMMAQGFATLAIDLRGAGESGGQMDDPNRLADVDAAVAFLKAQAEVDPANILLVGANDGAWWALKYASEHPDIRGAALITPGIRYDEDLLQQVMAAYGDRPLFLAVSDNPAIGDENAVKTAKRLDQLATGPHELVILDDNAWGIGLLMQENGLAARLLAWMEEAAGG